MALEPVVSIVIPAYQAEKTLGAAISSVLTQTYERTEIVVCSDGSTDATDDIARSYGDRVRLVRQENAGVSAARNHALEAATGDLVALLDADDLWLPRYLERSVDVWRDAGGGRRLVASTAYFLTKAGIAPKRRVITDVVPREAQRLRALESPFVPVFALFPRSLYAEIGGFDTGLRTAEDYDFWLRAIFRGWEVLFQMEPHALYRRTGTSLSADVAQLGRDETTMFRKLLDDPHVSLTAAERARLQDRLQSEPPLAYIDRGEAALQAGDARAAAGEFAAAARLLPSNRGVRRKAALLKAPLTGPALARLQALRQQQT